jgi:TPP-dependent pyruvate/acetoin dehydrogenase alpha subunit
MAKTGTVEGTGVADLETRLSIYRMMQEGRLFEERARDLFLQGLVKGTSHLGIGQEAVAAGFAAALEQDDLVFCTYRGHVHTLLRGAPMAALMAELLGRATGICGGKGGSMHLTDVSHGAMGSYAIVGAHMPIAAGAAWAAKARGTSQVAVCFFGDGTTNIGTFHEALNLAAVWELPVVFVCENNLYMEYTAIGDVTAVEHPAADRAAAYGLEPILIDGNDADVVHATAVRTVARARSGDGPSLVEAVTYRHGGHSRADPGKYRPDDEVAEGLRRDPIPSYRERLLAAGAEEGALAEIDRRALSAVDRATEEAREAPFPDPDTLETELWADGGSAWRN